MVRKSFLELVVAHTVLVQPHDKPPTEINTSRTPATLRMTVFFYSGFTDSRVHDVGKKVFQTSAKHFELTLTKRFLAYTF